MKQNIFQTSFEQFVFSRNNALGVDSHIQGREVRKYWETDEDIVEFGLFVRFVTIQKNKKKTALSFKHTQKPTV